MNKLSSNNLSYLKAITYLPEIYHDVIRGGKFFLAIDEMHKRYGEYSQHNRVTSHYQGSLLTPLTGPIVRINPDEVHLDDPDMLDTIFPGAGRRTNKPDVVGKRTGSKPASPSDNHTRTAH